jgi:hypothetical protein
VWTVTYTSTGNDNDYATDLTFDATGNIIICGAVQIGTLDYDAITLKYDASGELLWSQTYAGAGNGPDALTCAVTDANNNVYVSGGTYASITQLTNMLLIKYNSTGTQQWANTWNNGTYNMQDASFRILLSGNYANCYGATQTSANPVTWKLANAQFYQSNGNLNGSSTSYGDNEDFAEVKDIIVESNYYVTACGYSTASGQGKNLKVTKFNQTLASIWNYTYNNTSNNDDVANSLELYGSLLYVGGYTTLADGTKDIVVAKLNYNIGTASWLTTHDGGTGENDEAIDLATDVTGQLYLCGNSYKVGNSDYYVAKLKNTTGEVLAQNHFNGANNLDDIASNMVVTSTGDIYIAGQTGVSGASGNSYKYALTKWCEKTIYTPKPTDGFSSSGGYITNNKQLRNEDGTGNATVRFYCQQNTPSTYIDDTTISYVYSSPQTDTLETDTIHRVDVQFNKGMTHAKVYPVSERPEYANYYLGHIQLKSERTAMYNAIVKVGVYANTDVIFTNNDKGYRQWIVARTGAPLNDFEMEYTGQSSLIVNANGALVIGTSVGNQVQPKAKAYTMNNTTGMLTLLSWQPSYVITSSNKVSFSNLGSWTGTLVIEMQKQTAGGGSTIENFELEWSTYFGGQDFDYMHDIEGDEMGRSWVVGNSRSPFFPEILGSDVLMEYVGGTDAVIAAFNSDCSVSWLTYYGGENDDRANGVTRTDLGNIVVAGWTQSTDFPNFAGGPLNDSELGGFTDGFLVKLTPMGFTMLDSYIGGDASDWIMDVAFNQFGASKDIYLVGHSMSDETTFPIVSPSGAYNQPFIGTSTGSFIGDGFIVRINELSSQIAWSTFFGSDVEDNCVEIAFAANDVFIVGETTSNEYSADECSVPTDGHLAHCVQGGSWGNDNFGVPDEVKYFITRFDRTTNSLEWSTIISQSISNSISVGYSEEIGIASASPSSLDLYVCGGIDAADIADFPFIVSSNANSYNQSDIEDWAPFLFRFRIAAGFNLANWSTAVSGIGFQTGTSVAVSSDGTVYLTGFGGMDVLQAEADWCEVPTDDGFPMCNASGNSYMETNIDDTWWRATISTFNSSDQIVWSTQFGNFHNCRAYNSDCAGDYFYICGYSHFPETLEPTWTLHQYDELSTADYWQPEHGGEYDGVVSRFHRTLITRVDENELVTQNDILLFPVPNDGILNVMLPNEFALVGSISVIDDIGREVFTTTLNSRITTLDLRELAVGCYIIKVNNGLNVVSKSYVKQ